MRPWMVLAATALWTGVSVAASAELWISIGSYRGPQHAEQARATLEPRVGRALRIAEYELRGERRFRVVTGPYPDWASARASLNEIRSVGFADAWVVTEPMKAVSDGAVGVQVETTVATDSSTPAQVGVESYTEWSDLDRALEGMSIEELLATPYAEEPGPAALETQPDRAPFPAEATTEVPAGYRLHRLRRDDE